MSILRKLLGGSTSPKEVRVTPTRQQLDNAFAAMENATHITDLEQRMAGTSVAVHVIDWRSHYLHRPQVAIDKVNHDLGELWFELAAFKLVRDRLPLDIRDSMPSNVKVDIAKAWRAQALAATLRDLDTSLDLWERLDAVRTEDSELDYAKVHYSSLRASWFRIFYILADANAALTRWNGNEDISTQWQRNAQYNLAEYKKCIVQLKEYMTDLKMRRPDQFSNLGFTDDMLKLIDCYELRL